METCIVIPTYNEASNINRVLDAIYTKDNTKDVSVLIVDDNSPDGTAALVKKYENPNVHLLLKKKKEGLGTAYIAGMKYALEYLKPRIIFEMDADLSHNPKYIPVMLEEIRKGYDFVIGSRYIEGGSLPNDWGTYRKSISRIANTYTKLALGIKVMDCTGGFRAMKSNIFENIELEKLGVRGYAFQISLLNEVICRGYKVKEIPIHFEDRHHGVSKMGASDMLEFGLTVAKLRLRAGI